MGNFITMIIHQIQGPDLVYNSWCGPALPFCYFSESNAKSLGEAQSSCKEVKASSYPIEILNSDMGQVLSEYAKNYSIFNVILNAVKKNGSWYWIKADKEIGEMENVTEDGGLYVYNKNPKDPYLWVVCLTECLFAWTSHLKMESTMNALETVEGSPTLDQCKDKCDKNDKCSSINIKSIMTSVECTLLGYPYDESKLKAHRGTHYVIDRESRTVARCIGDYAGKEKSLPWIPILILIGLGLLVLFLIFLVVNFLFSVGRATSTEASASSS